jgi:hypothetical protein
VHRRGRSARRAASQVPLLLCMESSGLTRHSCFSRKGGAIREADLASACRPSDTEALLPQPDGFAGENQLF